MEITELEYKRLLNQMENITNKIDQGFESINNKLNKFEITDQNHELRIFNIEEHIKDRNGVQKEIKLSTPTLIAAWVSILVGIAAVVVAFYSIK
jgi:hypothetical protein